MELWWNSLDIYLKIMWGIAIPFSFIFVIQMIMTFVGMGDQGEISGDADADSDTGMPFQFFTFRNLVNFFLGFSWAGISFYPAFNSMVWLTLLCVFIGLLLVAIVMALLYALSKTTQSGNIDINNAIGRPATVYFTIPSAGKGVGKIQMSIQQAVREYDAISESDEPFRTGSMVRVKSVIDAHTLLVEPL
jgi:membrane protein implicated in regulation of membrane protease activity